ncbi:MAG TPA: hypothetical protein VGI98_03735 [Candidatus Limnocylindrales bacterium]
MPIASPRRLLGSLLSLVLVACGPGPSPSPTLEATPSPTAASSPAASVDAAAVYGAIARQVEAIRGLQPTGDVAPVLLDADQLRANLTATFDKDNPPAAVRETEALYRVLGLLPLDVSLRTAELDLLAGQVAGYYSPDQKQLFVVSRSGGIGPSQRVTYAHEFTHQLQDQHFDLAKVQGSATGQGDRSLAVLALIEGDAVSVQTAWTAANLNAADLAQLLADASDPSVVQSLLDAPPILRLLSLAPYTAGQAFVAALQASGGEAAVNAAFRDPPSSTSEVVHPDLYATHAPPGPVAWVTDLRAALGSGWSSLGQDTLGELFVRSWLQAGGVPVAQAGTAAAGDEADRIELFAGPAGQVAAAIQLRWSSDADADEFLAAWQLVRSKVVGLPAVTTSGHTVTLTIAPSQAMADALLQQLVGPVPVR